MRNLFKGVFSWGKPSSPYAAESKSICVVQNCCQVSSSESDVNQFADSNQGTVVLDGWCRTSSGERLTAKGVLDSLLSQDSSGVFQGLEGDFSLVFSDKRNHQIYLVRDRFGSRPLFYAVRGETVFFASRMKAILSSGQISRDLNQQTIAAMAAAHYRFFDNDRQASVFKEIKQVEPGHLVQISVKGIQPKNLHPISEKTSFTESEAELGRVYRDKIFESVGKRLDLGSQLAFTLSGGMDSSSILASARELTGKKQIAYSAVYQDPTFDESKEIRSMLSDHVSEWRPIQVSAQNLFETIEEMVSEHEEPVVTATWFSHYLLCREAQKDGVNTLMSGLGGDELNAGEYEYFPCFFADLKISQPSILEQEILAWARHHDHPIYKKNLDEAYLLMKNICDLTKPGQCVVNQSRLLKYADLLNPQFFQFEKFKLVMEHPFSSYLKNRAYQDLTRETVPCCLRAQDRNAAAFGIDVLNPFLDSGLVDFMFRVPVTSLIRNGVTKVLLREAMKGVLP